MPRPKLSITQVKRIKALLLEGNYTHEQIAKKYGVKRPAISKIHLGMINPLDPNGRWGDIEI